MLIDMKVMMAKMSIELARKATDGFGVSYINDGGNFAKVGVIKIGGEKEKSEINILFT